VVRSKAFSSRSWWLVGIYDSPAQCGLTVHLNIFLGAAGTGRTTFVNTLCESEVLEHKPIDGPETANVEAVLRIRPVNVGEFVVRLILHPNCISHEWF
jgi:hypothetical protein